MSRTDASVPNARAIPTSLLATDTGKMKTAMVFGASGAVGKCLLSQLLSSDHYAKVHIISRRPFKDNSTFRSETRLEEHIIDFDKLIDDDARDDNGSAKATAAAIKEIAAETVYITLGTTRAQAGSASNFVKIDRDYVLAGAKAALSTAEGNGQRLVYCSSSGANTKSFLPYLKSKGQTEEGLAKLGYSECIVIRPAFLSGAQRERTKTTEKIFSSMMTSIGGRLSDNAEIQVTDVGRAIAMAGIKGTEALSSMGVGTHVGGGRTFINNLDAKKLAK
ncbi:hypothetical protein CBS101457_004893 [Exobasidium rhododendri]|nr:hypothetical protein CBS101457_004893 [Exobasidium rhododendri]